MKELLLQLKTDLPAVKTVDDMHAWIERYEKGVLYKIEPGAQSHERIMNDEDNYFLFADLDFVFEGVHQTAMNHRHYKAGEAEVHSPYLDSLKETLVKDLDFLIGKYGR